MTSPDDDEIRLFMTADSVGGVWTYVLDLARALVAHRVVTTLAVLGPSPGPAAMAAARGIPRLDLLDTGLPLDWVSRNEAEVAEASVAMAELAQRTEAHVVQLNGPTLAAFGEFRQPLVGFCHSCVASWWDAVRGGTMHADMLWRTGLLTRGYAACDVLVAPSASFAAATRQHHGRLPVVVHNGRASCVGPAVPRERFVLTAGRLWDDGKNVAVLDEAAGLIDAPVWAAGPLTGPEGSTIRLRHAHTLGSLAPEALAGWMARAPIFASTALYEPFGLAVLEAAQAGCALVLSDIASFQELWEGAAIFVPANRPAALAGTLRHLLDAPERAAELGAAARRHAARYGMVPVAGAMNVLYRQLLQPARTSPAHETQLA